jgi:hypothetical protein
MMGREASTGALARMLEAPSTKAGPHETRDQMKNYGADINRLTELLESGKL